MRSRKDSRLIQFSKVFIAFGNRWKYRCSHDILGIQDIEIIG